MTDTIFIATRGSALALAQANMILAQCRAAFPEHAFELKIIRTTGDKLQSASLAQESRSLPKGLFTKELEVALLNREASLAVHSLKDLPTELPDGLKLGAVGKREDVRDVLIYRDAEFLRAHPDAGNRRGFQQNLSVAGLPDGAVVATSSTRRKAQLLARHPRLNVPDIRGNVATRMHKLMDQSGLDATVLALAGITRLQFHINAGGHLTGDGVPDGLLATVLDLDLMLPCVGQGAIGIEVRADDDAIAEVCRKLNHDASFQSVTAERAFLSGMGGGCQSPVGAYAEVVGNDLRMRAISFASGAVRRGEARRPMNEAETLGRQLAAELK